MPVYVYRNLNTNETFEIEQRITEGALTHHPETGDPVKRLIQPVGIAFKGSGFYVTDSRGKTATKSDSKTDNNKTDSSQKSSSAETVASSKTDSGESSKKDAKKETSSSKTPANTAS